MIYGTSVSILWNEMWLLKKHGPLPIDSDENPLYIVKRIMLVKKKANGLKKEKYWVCVNKD